MAKKPEDILYKIKTEVSESFFAEEPLKKFPEDFLSAKAKKELAPSSPRATTRQALPFKLGVKISGRYHRLRRAKIDGKKVKAVYALAKAMEEKSTAKYEEVALPGGKLKLNFGKQVQICFENGTVLLEFNTLERAKYILYARKKGNPPEAGKYIYKVPKSEIVVKRAVQKYENYLKETRDKLIKAYAEKGADKIIAESLARQVFEDIDLPYIEEMIPR